MSIRTATIEDLNTISEIENLCFSAEEAASLETLEKRLKTFPHHFFVLEENGKIVGFINGMVTDNDVIIDEMFKNTSLHDDNGKWQSVFGLAVSPDFQKKGYAGQLIDHIIAVSKQQNQKGVVLTCKAKLVPYYKKFGFYDAGISNSVYAGLVWHDMRIEH